MKKLFLLFLILLIPSITFSEDLQPLELTIKPDKEAYKEGDRITVLYTIENVSEKPVGFFEGDLYSEGLNLDGKPLDSYTYPAQYCMGGLGKYIVLKSKEKWSGKKEFAEVIFHEIKDFEIVKGKPFKVAMAIKKEGFMLSRGETKLLLPRTFQGKFIISAEYHTADPNPYKFNLTPEECEKIKKKGYESFSHEPFFPQNLLDMDRQIYCQEYETRNKPAFIGSIKSDPTEVQLELGQIKDGISKSYYEDGNVRMEREYKNGKLNGITKYYYRGYYPSKDSQYYVNMPVYGIRNYSDGKLTGEGKDFYNNNKVAYIWNFKDGELNGEARSYSKDGKLIGEANYFDGELNGVVRQYLADGTLEYSAQFKNGKLNGTESYYYPTMKMMLTLNEDYGKIGIKIEGNYKDGKMDGPFRTFYERGQLESESIYQNDKLVNTKNYDKMGNIVFDYDYNCDESQQSNVYSQVPVEAKMFLKRVEVNKDGVSISMKDNLKQKYKTSPIYLSKYFDDKGHLFISKDADLTKYRLEGLPEHEDLKQYAFIAAYREEDKSDDKISFQYLYFGKFEDRRAVFLIRKGFPTEKQKSSHYIYIDKTFEDVKKCKDTR